MLETGKSNVDQLNDVGIADIKYHPVSTEDEWKISIYNDLVLP